jgi:hypothetical protein
MLSQMEATDEAAADSFRRLIMESLKTKTTYVGWFLR